MSEPGHQATLSKQYVISKWLSCKSQLMQSGFWHVIFKSEAMWCKSVAKVFLQFAKCTEAVTCKNFPFCCLLALTGRFFTTSVCINFWLNCFRNFVFNNTCKIIIYSAVELISLHTLILLDEIAIYFHFVNFFFKLI